MESRPFAAQRACDARRAVKSANIAPLPKCLDPARRENCRGSLRAFLETYFPEAFVLGWSPDMLEVIAKIQQALDGGGLFVVAMPRGSGKTTVLIRAAIWAILYGKASFVFLVAADGVKAKGMLKSIKTEIEFNPLLFADFPEACHPVRCLQGAAQGAGKQHIDGAPTSLDWTADVAQFATIAGSECSGGRIGVGGITAASRGAQVTLPDGRVIRPSLVLVDDFQTRESAASASQTRTRLSILTADLGGMRPPSGDLAMLAAVTVIHQGDAADQLLNRVNFPEWHGTRKKLLYSFPTHMNLWDEYFELRRAAFRRDEAPTAADAYYLSRQAEMDEGAQVGWEQRKTDRETTALQHAMNLFCDFGEEAFASEYQNAPLALEDGDYGFLTSDQIAEKLNNLEKNLAPASVTKITAAIDVQSHSLWWCVVAWADGFSGWILDYGTFPQQGRRHYTKRELPVTLSLKYPELSEEQAIYQGLIDLTSSLMDRRWALSDGSRKSIDRLLVDEGYKPDTVHLFCRQHAHGNIMPIKGMAIRAGRQPMADWPKKKGERVGLAWRIRPVVNDRNVRHVLADVNIWKTFVQQRLASPFGGDGCLSLWGSKSFEHRLFASHLTAETPTRTEGHGRSLIEWELKTNGPDNEWLDTLAYCAVAASEQGITVMGEGPPAKKTRKQPAGRKSVAQRRRERMQRERDEAE